MTVLELITASMHRLGYLEASEVPTAEDALACVRAANDFIDALALEELFIYRIERAVFNLAANTGSYTIGPGATFDTPRPVWIERCGVIPDPAATPVREIPLGPPLSAQEYALVSQKAATGAYPTAVYYDPTIAGGFGTIRVVRVPDSATPDLVLYLPALLSEFDEGTAYDEEVVLPKGYRRFLVTNLAVEFAPILGSVVSAELAAAALDARKAVQSANVRPEELLIGFDVPGMGRAGRYDINAG